MLNKIGKIVLIGIVAALLIALAVVWFAQIKENDQFISAKKTFILIGKNNIKVDVADSPAELVKGLSGRTTLADDEGMFFIFPNNDYHGIWMKNMKLPIDIIWLDETLKVVFIKEKVLPETYPEVFKPTKPARYVIETPAGFTAKAKIKIGDLAKINFSEPEKP